MNGIKTGVEVEQLELFNMPHNAMSSANGLKAIDLFCGIGGFRLALDKCSFSTILSSDIDKYAQQTYQANFGDLPLGDIYSINIKDIPNFDILTAGFPCQPFSYAGKKEGFKNKMKGTLFFKVLEILELKKPKMFLLENVKGLKSHDKGKTMKTILSSLKALGYDVYWKIISSLNFGIPQKRERWYCVGFKQKTFFEFPKGKNKNVVLRDIIDVQEKAEKLRISESELKRISYHFKMAKNGERIQHDNSKYAPNTKKGKYGIYSYQKPDGSLRFHVGDKAKTQIQEAFYCCLDTYAPTIIAGRVPKLWDIERKLSVKEAQRLQGFPDGFIFPVSNNQAYKQLGNSVTVPVVEAILNAMVYAFKTNQ